jgi:protein TonB
MVTLFDAAKLTKLRVLEDTGGAVSGSAGAVAASGPLVGATAPDSTTAKQRAVPETPAPRSKPQVRPKALPQDPHEDPSGAAAQTEAPLPAPAPVTPVPAAGTQTTAATPGPLANAGSAPGGKGGSPTGTQGVGSGSGTGSGSGIQAGVASGDTTVLPFMDGMTRPSVVSKVDPEFTREARDANVQGLILTKCVITTSGNLRNCRIVKGVPMMDQAVLKALSQWRYTPVLYQGKPVAVEYVIPVRLVTQ